MNQRVPLILDSSKPLLADKRQTRYSVRCGNGPYEAGSSEFRDVGWSLYNVAISAGYETGDIVDVFLHVEVPQGSRKEKITHPIEGVLCADGSFELTYGPHEGFEAVEYLSRRVGSELRRLGCQPGLHIVEVEVSAEALGRDESPTIMDRKMHGRLMKMGD